MNNAILVSIEDNVAIITINRPEALNAINKDVMEGLKDFFEKNKNNTDLRGVIITGAGDKAFVAGADIKEFSSLNAQQGSALSKKGQDVFMSIENFHVPVIAVINGFALGGGNELAMACHMRVATEKSKFGQPEVNLGLIPGYGATQRLPKLIGRSKAMELLLTADMIDANTALHLGLINHVTPIGEEMNKAKEILSKIATKGPIAVKHIISCVNTNTSAEGYEMEYKLFGECIESDDAIEGANAFIEKRKANFKGV
jgi:enoyl-CoA hydratase